MPGSNARENNLLSGWDPTKHLRAISAAEVRFSRGFLRARPEKWFPAMSTYWLPLAHSLGLELRVMEVRPVISPPENFSVLHVATVDGEPLAIAGDEITLMPLLELIVPGAEPVAREIVAEYLARRFFGNLASSWSGPEGSTLRFESDFERAKLQGLSAIKIALDLNGTVCTLWILVGKGLADRLDGLWRRQLKAGARQIEGSAQIELELSEILLSPASLGEMLRPGTLMECEANLSDAITLKLEGKNWLPARLCRMNENFAFEVVSGPVSTRPLPSGLTRLSVQIGKITTESALLPELSQIGAFCDTEIPVSDRVHLVVNGERVAEAVLCLVGGRFSVTVC